MRTPKRTSIVAAVAAVWLVAVMAVGVVAQAQTPAAPGAEDQFVPVKTLPPAETLPASTLVMGAYAFVWAVLLVYVWTVWRRLMKVEREIRTLADRLGEKGART